MTPENVQWNRDSLLSVEGRESKRDSAQKIDCSQDESSFETVIHVCPPVAITELMWQREKEKEQPGFLDVKPGKNTTKVVFDTSTVTKKIEEVLKNFCPPLHDDCYARLNTLKRMQYGLTRFRANQQYDNLEILEQVDLTKLFPFFEERMVKIAEWMMFSEAFRVLSTEDKMAIYKEACTVWNRLEMTALSVKIYGTRMLEEKLVVVSTDKVIKGTYTVFDLSNLSDHSNENIKDMFAPFFKRMIEEIAKPLIDMHASDEEIIYMLCQVCWHFAGRVQGEVSRASDQFREQIANDIHDYYVNDRLLPNYASRIIKLMSIVNAMQKLHMDRQKMVELAMLFDVFKVEFSDQKLFSNFAE